MNGKQPTGYIKMCIPLEVLATVNIIVSHRFDVYLTKSAKMYHFS